MSTIFGNGQGIDVSLNVSAQLATSTSQYLCVGMQGETTSADRTVYLTNSGNALADTTTARTAIGINMSNMLSTGSNHCDVRVLGQAKAKCAGSVASGDFFIAYEGASTTTFAGHIVSLASGTTQTSASTTAHHVVMGRVLQDGSTNSVVEVLLIPSLMDQSNIGGA